MTVNKITSLPIFGLFVILFLVSCSAATPKALVVMPISTSTQLLPTNTATNKKLSITTTNTPFSSPTPSKYYSLIYQKENSIMRIKVDEYGNIYPAEELLSVNGFLAGEDLSSDGKQIAYLYIEPEDISNKSDLTILKIYNLGTKEDYVLRNKGIRSMYPKWSPNNRFISYAYLEKYIFEIRIDPSTECIGDDCYTRYFRYKSNNEEGIVNLTDPSWSNDSNTLIFLLNRIGTWPNLTELANTNNELCIGDIKTIHFQCPINNMEIDPQSFLFTKDDNILLFQSSVQATQGIYILYLQDYLETGDVEYIKISPNDATYKLAFWDMDNQQFYYIKKNNTGTFLYRAETIGSSPDQWMENAQIISSNLLQEPFALSNDGQMIVWNYTSLSYNMGICFYSLRSGAINIHIHCLPDAASNLPQWIP